MSSVQIEIVHLLVSARHAYAGRPGDWGSDAVDPDSESRDSVDVVAHRGIVGDRYYGRAAHARASVSFIAAETFEAIAHELGIAPAALDPRAARRNVVVRGVDVDALVGQEFGVDCGSGLVLFAARRPTRPCAWMDVALAPGAWRAMRGRGGVGCVPLTTGQLRLGAALLVTA